MPRWKALPEELDPEVGEFTCQLRGLIDRSGLSIAAVADRTGYSKTSWERYLNGRLLAPKRAIIALAEVTGTNQTHLTTMWELAERAWGRSEMRHDMTMEAIRISQARSALGEFGRGAAGGSAGALGAGAGPPGGTVDLGTAGSRPGGHSVPPPAGRAAASGPGAGPGRGRRKGLIFGAGIVGALAVVGAALLFTDIGGDGDAGTAAKSPSAAPTTSAPKLPAGVKCGGDDCTGQDPEEMGCGGEFAETVDSARVGTSLIEVRYSKTCGSAWARITQAAPGDEVRISSVRATGEEQTGAVETTNDAYTPMTAVPDAKSAKACATLKAGVEGCTSAE
ncbi:XRE family transcriptional regulator [Streptomyces sp. NPDC087850]|uniref:XRE family transcriptional regulator n=1 Tax=unclassified Streptomyces TaxID=2593676 RepID=UPI0037FCADB6